MHIIRPIMAQPSQPVNAIGYAARDSSGVLSPFQFTRRAAGDRDVQFKVLYCGICHSDLHSIRNEWGNTHYPIVAGHEIVGKVTQVGSEVRKFRIGDKVGAGYLINSCGECEQCGNDLENYCPKMVVTYNSIDKDGTITHGGYSDILVADEHYLIRWPENFPMEAAPLLCAGITTYSPLKYYGLDKPGQHIGVVGLGGLGHVAVKFAKAFGAKVTVISTSINKKPEALQNLKADTFLVSRDQTEMQSAASTFDGILDTVAAPHPIQPLVMLLKPHGKLVLLGVVPKPFELTSPGLILGRKIVGGSSIGGIKETQEMIDFAAEKNVLPDVEVVGMDYVNEAMERLHKGDVKYRFVIDVANTLKSDH